MFRILAAFIVVTGCLSLIKALVTGGDSFHDALSLAAFTLAAYLTDTAWTP